MKKIKNEHIIFLDNNKYINETDQFGREIKGSKNLVLMINLKYLIIEIEIKELFLHLKSKYIV